MAIPRSAIIAVLTIATATSGCRCPSGCCVPQTPCAPCVHTATVGDAAPPDLMRVVPDCQLENCGLQPLPMPGEIYHLLTPEDCQCRAATNANVSNMVELEEHWANVVIECDSKYVQRNVCLQRDLLELHAADLRNKAAGSALEAFYQLAALEARKFYLDRALEETRKSLERGENLRSSGISDAVDRDELAMQIAQLEDRRLQVRYARLQLNGQLQKLLACPVSEFDFFWPVVDWTPNMAAVDAEAELTGNIHNRYDLRGLSLVLCKLEKSTLRVARGVLQVADGTLGSVEPTEGWIHRLRCIRCNDHEVDVRCRQLAMLYADTEQLATAEIKGAVYQVVLQQQRIDSARRAVADRRAAVYEETALRDVDDTEVFEISKLRGRLFDAESHLVEQVAALKIAEARLRQAEAALAPACGFEPKLCCEGECTGHCMRCKICTCRPGEQPCRCEKCKNLDW